MKLPKNMLESGLFWEYDPEAVDVLKHETFIIGRILEYGDVEHIRWMLGQYGADTVKKVFEAGAPLGKKSENFWKKYFKSNVCTNKQLRRGQSMFLNR